MRVSLRRVPLCQSSSFLNFLHQLCLSHPPQDQGSSLENLLCARMGREPDWKQDPHFPGKLVGHSACCSPGSGSTDTSKSPGAEENHDEPAATADALVVIKQGSQQDSFDGSKCCFRTLGRVPLTEAVCYVLFMAQRPQALILPAPVFPRVTDGSKLYSEAATYLSGPEGCR